MEGLARLDAAELSSQHRRRTGTVLGVLRVVTANRALLRVELAYATFNAGEWSTWLAMLVYAYAHGGVTEAGVLATVMLVPAAVLAPVIAAVGERHPPGYALAAGYAAQSSTCVAVAAAMLLSAPHLLVYVLFAGPSIAFAMTRPSQAAFAPGLARRPIELAATNVVSGWIEGVSVLGGPLLVGLILGLSSPGTVFALTGALCAVGAALVAPLRRVVPTARREESEREPLTGPFEFIRRDPNARTLVLLLGAEAVALGALDVLYVELARGVLHRGGSWAGLLNAAFGGGAVLAIALTARLVGQPRLARPLAASLAAWSIALCALAVAPGALGSIALLLVAGGARSAFDVTARTLLQRVSRSDLLARVFGLLEGLEMAGLAAGSLLVPALVALGGPATALIGVAALLPLAAVAAGGRLLDIDRHATVPVVEVALMRSLPMFALLPPPILESLARSLVPVEVAEGEAIVRQGDPGDRFYIVADGRVDVVADGKLVNTLSRGDGFGEIALMYGVPRTATVQARTASQLYALEPEPFLVALTGHSASLRAAEELAQGRLGDLEPLRA